MKCSKCGYEYEGKFCPECGQSAPGTKIKCKNCGTEFEGKFCTNCGQSAEANQSSAPSQTPQIIINNTNTNANNATATAPLAGVRVKNKWVALLLCVFLGIFGAHKFYEGKILMGILYLFTVGLFGFGVIIDFFILLFKPNPYTV